MAGMITLKHISLLRGGKVLLEQADLTIFKQQKIGIIGQNGCGKSSLFKLLLGQLPLDNGELEIPKNLRIAHMAQEVASTESNALDYVLDGHQQLRQLEQCLKQALADDDHQQQAECYGEMETIHAYQLPSQAEQLLHGLGFEQSQLQNPVKSFSGGWRIRLNLAQALMSDADLLLLDEPTNHLDLDATIWLENYLKRYSGSLLLISHDRDFLDQVVSHIAHFERQKIISYTGNYSQFERQKAERLAQQQQAHEQQQAQIAHIESFIRRFKAKASKAKQAQSRVKELERMQRIAPAHIDSPFSFSFPAAEKFSSPLLSLKQANLGYKNPVLKNVNLSLLPGSRIALLGPNGAGKSTLIKSIVADLPMLNGERTCGEHLQIGYFAQHQLEALDADASPFLHIQRLSPQASEQSIRNYLGSFDFRGDKAFEAISNFSGGEKARVALAIITWQKPNVLLMDEPTNHLDLEMRQALTLALQDYQGALLLVSHDRHLLKNTVDEFYLIADGQVSEFDGDLLAYEQWLEAYKKQSPSAEPTAKPTERLDKKQQRQIAADKRKQLSPLKKQLQKLERQQEKFQQAIQTLEQELAAPELYEDGQKQQLQTLLLQQKQLNQELTNIETEWLELAEQLEELEQSIS